MKLLYSLLHEKVQCEHVNDNKDKIRKPDSPIVLCIKLIECQLSDYLTR